MFYIIAVIGLIPDALGCCSVESSTSLGIQDHKSLEGVEPDVCDPGRPIVQNSNTTRAYVQANVMADQLAYEPGTMAAGIVIGSTVLGRPTNKTKGKLNPELFYLCPLKESENEPEKWAKKGLRDISAHMDDDMFKRKHLPDELVFRCKVKGNHSTFYVEKFDINKDWPFSEYDEISEEWKKYVSTAQVNNLIKLKCKTIDNKMDYVYTYDARIWGCKRDSSDTISPCLIPTPFSGIKESVTLTCGKRESPVQKYRSIIAPFVTKNAEQQYFQIKMDLFTIGFEDNFYFNGSSEHYKTKCIASCDQNRPIEFYFYNDRKEKETSFDDCTGLCEVYDSEGNPIPDVVGQVYQNGTRTGYIIYGNYGEDFQKDPENKGSAAAHKLRISGEKPLPSDLIEVVDKQVPNPLRPKTYLKPIYIFATGGLYIPEKREYNKEKPKYFKFDYGDGPFTEIFLIYPANEKKNEYKLLDISYDYTYLDKKATTSFIGKEAAESSGGRGEFKSKLAYRATAKTSESYSFAVSTAKGEGFGVDFSSETTVADTGTVAKEKLRERSQKHQVEKSKTDSSSQTHEETESQKNTEQTYVEGSVSTAVSAKSSVNFLGLAEAEVETSVDTKVGGGAQWGSESGYVYTDSNTHGHEESIKVANEEEKKESEKDSYSNSHTDEKKLGLTKSSTKSTNIEDSKGNVIGKESETTYEKEVELTIPPGTKVSLIMEIKVMKNAVVPFVAKFLNTRTKQEFCIMGTKFGEIMLDVTLSRKEEEL